MFTMIARTIAISVVHAMDAAAEKGDFAAIEQAGNRLSSQAHVQACSWKRFCFIDPAIVTDLNAMPGGLIGMAVGGGMVGYAMVINMMATVRFLAVALACLCCY